MGNKRHKRAHNAAKLGIDPLYSRPCRIAVPIVQGFALACTTALVIMGAFFTLWDDLSSGNSAQIFLAILIWEFIPVVSWILSIIEVAKRYQRTLTASYLVISTVIAIIGWTGYACLGLLKINGTNDWTASDTYYFSHTWVAIAPLGLFLIQLILGAIALHRRRHPKNKAAQARNNFELEHGKPMNPSYNHESRPPSYHCDSSRFAAGLQSIKQ